jgi:RHO1 GDP-GTP exchange protein 1/2
MELTLQNHRWVTSSPSVRIEAALTSHFTGTPYVESPVQRNSSFSSNVGYSNQPSSLYNESINSGYASGPSPSLSPNNDQHAQKTDYLREQEFYQQRRPSIGLPNPSEMLHTLAEGSPGEITELAPEDGGEYWEDEEEDENRFINYSMLSHMAVQLRDKVPRGTHVKGSIPYPRAFTGKDIVVSNFKFDQGSLTS